MNVTAAVGEQDDALRPWTEAEETYLANAAGILSPENLGRALGRTEASVEEAAGQLGLDVRCDGASFVWCDHCATDVYKRQSFMCHATFILPSVAGFPSAVPRSSIRASFLAADSRRAESHARSPYGLSLIHI